MKDIEQKYNKNSDILFCFSNIFLFILQFFKLKLFYLDEYIIWGEPLQLDTLYAKKTWVRIADETKKVRIKI